MSLWPTYPSLPLPWTPPWDHGIHVSHYRTVDPVDPPLDLSYVAEKVLRVMNDQEEYDYIRMLLQAATSMAEARYRAAMPQTWALTLSAFPLAEIRLPMVPVIEVVSFTYTDADGDSQTLAASPADYRLIPSGPDTRARIIPLHGEAWPASRADDREAITVTYRAGFEEADRNSPQWHKLVTGIALVVGEAYKNRALSVQDIQNIPTVLQLEHFWRRVR